jgi:hypothetical protein
MSAGGSFLQAVSARAPTMVAARAIFFMPFSPSR